MYGQGNVVCWFDDGVNRQAVEKVQETRRPVIIRGGLVRELDGVRRQDAPASKDTLQQR